MKAWHIALAAAAVALLWWWYDRQRKPTGADTSTWHQMQDMVDGGFINLTAPGKVNTSVWQQMQDMVNGW